MNLLTKPKAFGIISKFLKENPNGVIEILGPTASGKTGLSLEIAQFIHQSTSHKAQIISVDSRQVYRECDISSAKITKEEMQGILHHGLDLVDPTQEYNVYQFQQYAFHTIETIQSQGHIPILCGGTMLWLDAISENYKFSDQSRPSFDKKGGRGENLFEKSTQKNDPKWPVLKLGLYWDREILYQRINQRAIEQFKSGLIEETDHLIQKYHLPSLCSTDNDPVMNINVATSFGYLEINEYLQGRMTYQEALQKNQQRNRNYAKRQMTWWRGREDIHWINMKEDE